jgi:hypothetical protein
MTDLDLICQLRPEMPLGGPGELRPTYRRLARAIAAEAGSPGQEASRPASRPRRRRLALAAAGLAVVMLAAGAAVAMGRSAPHPRPGTIAGTLPGGIAGTRPPRTPAARLLDKIAYAAARQPAPTVRDNQYQYVKSVEHYDTQVTQNGKTTTYMPPPDIRQWWQPVSDLCRPSLILEGGSYQWLTDSYRGQKCPDKGSLADGDPTYRFLQSLPTDPHTLLQRIYAADQDLKNEVKLPPGQSYYAPGQSAYSYAFDDIGSLVNDSIVPPQLSAALYRAAALIPGVTLVADAVNAAGQHGVAVAFAYSGQREEWIFSNATLQYIGQLDVDTKTGAVTGGNAILARAFVDRPGQLPSRHG